MSVPLYGPIAQDLVQEVLGGNTDFRRYVWSYGCVNSHNRGRPTWGWLWFPTSVKAPSHFPIAPVRGRPRKDHLHVLMATYISTGSYEWYQWFFMDNHRPQKLTKLSSTNVMFRKKVWITWGYAFMIILKIYKEHRLLNSVMYASWVQ